MQGAVCGERGEELKKLKVLQNQKKEVLIPETDERAVSPRRSNYPRKVEVTEFGKQL